ncbi:hypothetical protein [Bradyrhizobium australiense]|uniref:Uncharacterized protein n=1 Tax=Bradyrhizobium australiense TaxID=2721161 RepID=A0A7Y4LX56_9BRAD|nr:hypothetical protein [Bradyrhizobium australiense]NOJ41385.1 hypothetical protein [Bradyrhizobium australiense]
MDFRRTSHCLAASSITPHAARSSSKAACFIAFMICGDIIVRNCLDITERTPRSFWRLSLFNHPAPVVIGFSAGTSHASRVANVIGGSDPMLTFFPDFQLTVDGRFVEELARRAVLVGCTSMVCGSPFKNADLEVKNDKDPRRNAALWQIARFHYSCERPARFGSRR